MNDIYLDIHLSVPPDDSIRELIPAALSEYPFEGFVDDDRGVHCFIKKELWHGSIETIIKEISELYHLPFLEYLSTTEIRHQNWNEEWERSITPIEVSDRCIITPSWHPVEAPGKTVIIIDPKMTFGTGFHETTRLMIRMMEKHLRSGAAVLDVGTGTGVLAIAAVKMGAQHCVGIDIDEWSLENGRENAMRNGVSDRIDIRIGSMETVTESSFDCILANIIRNTILELMDAILAKLAPGGLVLFSGLLTADRSAVEAALEQRGYTVAEMLRENDWIALAARRR